MAPQPAHFSPLLPLLQPVACRLANLSRLLTSALAWNLPGVPLHVAAWPWEEGAYIHHEVSAGCGRLQSTLNQTQAPHLPPLPIPFSAHSAASFLLLGAGGFWLMSSPPCPPFSHTHPHTHNFCLSSLCLCSRASRSRGGRGWGPLSASGGS